MEELSEHAFYRGQIIKQGEDFDKSVMWLADGDTDKANSIMRGSVKQWIYKVEMVIDEIVRSRNPTNNIDD